MNEWMTWREFRRLLRSKGMSKSMSGYCMVGIVDGVPFEVHLNGQILGRWIAKDWLVREV